MNVEALRQQLSNALQNRQAHQLFDDVVMDFPAGQFQYAPD